MDMARMNYFVLIAGLLYVGASVTYFIQGNYLLGIAFVGYALANFALMLV